MLPKIIIPAVSEDSLSEGLRELTKILHANGREKASGMLGGTYGYGTDYENAVFKMRPFCWCDRDLCPWCGGCQDDSDDTEHTQDCYRWLVYNELIRLGFLPAKWAEGGPYVERPQKWDYTYAQKLERRVRQRWCQALGLPYPSGCAVHCTCGADEADRQRRAACRCEYCTATGAFGEAGAEPGKGAPNFWHKPSGLKVWWYKYIGRGMQVHNPNNIALHDLLNSCIKSLGEENEIQD